MTNNKASDTILLSKEMHKGNWIVLLKFRGRRDWLNSIKQLSDIKFSRTKGYWYISYSKTAYNAFLELDIPYTLPSTHVETGVSTEVPASDHDHTGIDVPKDIAATSFSSGQKNVDIQEHQTKKVTWNSGKFIIEMAYDVYNVAFVKKLEASWWNQKSRMWVCKGTLRNLEKIQKEWQIWPTGMYEQLYHQIGTVNNPCKISLYYSPKYKDEICVRLIGHGANHQYIKAISGRVYHKNMKIYTIPAKREVTDALLGYYKDIGYTIDNRLQVYNTKEKEISTSQKLDRYLSKFRPDYYTVLKKMVTIMHRRGYGVRTIQQYTGKLARVMDHYKTSDLDSISLDKVHGFIDLLQERGASFNLVNQVYSALKLYFAHVSPDTDFPVDGIKRPKKPFSLPKFISEGEVIRLFAEINNVKHKAILYMLYGSGLRKGEVLALKLEHIYWDRDQILIKAGKGNKDRMAILSTETKAVLEIYFHEYKPQVYLFEGMKPGKKYGESNANKIIHKATRAANLSKKVTPHALRHSFATHLMDGGVSLPLIQKLMGHKDIKTTLIYTHVSNTNLMNVVSPLDRLKNKISPTAKGKV